MALWEFDGNLLNQSGSSTYCNPVSDANLALWHPGAGGTLQYDTVHTRQGTASLVLDGTTTIEQPAPPTLARECLRQRSPATWTLTAWSRNTAASLNVDATLVYDRDYPSTGGGDGWWLGYCGLGDNVQCVTGRLNLCSWVGGVKKPCKSLFTNPMKNDGEWRFVTAQWTGTQFRMAMDGGDHTTGGVKSRLPRNRGTYPFQISHTPWGIQGNVDEVWWVAAQLTQQQSCRVRSVGVRGMLGYCAATATAWKTCDTDADCGGRAGACNRLFPSGGKSGTCVGHLRQPAAGDAVPSGCQTVAQLGPCNAGLTATAATTTTSTTTTTSLPRRPPRPPRPARRPRPPRR